ncbi:undecaprenyl-diphosphate phosphatase [Sphingomonas oligophenolica]|uniref:Undecaprenyl-diphosphatase n=1 Tax=Sphingomonas oligophenolica TaxID=301154 RepID=A0A502CIU1_9SPHN|nr:undecaprenyl-diphosphate phosphatase [Sphingomonas oligophenolica]TPG13545.1 undecaprenyl-diphosphate phosphatase [Sphingomonas oligophenolica]
MDILTVILLGIVEGVTEFLPVSSTGHLILASALLGYDSETWAVFNIVIQLGAILAIVVLYWRTFWVVLVGLFKRDALAIRFVRNILVAFIPAAVIGFALHKKIEALLGQPIVVAVALVVGGIAIIGIERITKPGEVRGVAEVPLGTVIGIGFIQCLAMVPGVSRSGATILGALALGVERRTAAEFSFFLAIPTMLGATTLELVANRHALAGGAGVGLGAIALGTLVAFVVALVVVRWFVTLVGRTGFSPFGWYRIVVGAAAFIWLISK